MVEQFISYLAHLPTDSTSPLFVELNASALLAALGGPDSGVHVYDTNAQDANVPFVKLYDAGQRQRTATYLGGSYLEKQILTCDCVATGKTPTSAINKAELLKLAIEGEVKNLQSALSGITVRTDLGGTASTESVSNIQIGSVDREMAAWGQKDEWTAQRTALIEILVFKGRKQ